MVERAVQSVLCQSHNSFEVLVVNDGSDGENEEAYQRLAEKYRGKVVFLDLDQTLSGHGQCYAVNVGAHHASGKFLGFLDDDDFWIDDTHLARVSNIIAASRGSVDVVLSNQQSCSNGDIRLGWLAGVEYYAREKLKADQFGAYEVTAKDLMSCGGFGHPNAMIVKHTLFDAIGGFDRHLRCQTDRDFYVRIVDKAKKIAYSPAVTAQHSVPDKSKSANVSTGTPDDIKLLARLYYQNKAIMFSEKREVRFAARKHKAYTLKRIARSRRLQHDYHTASHYAGQALMVDFSLKWLVYYMDTQVRCWFARSR